MEIKKRGIDNTSLFCDSVGARTQDLLLRSLYSFESQTTQYQHVIELSVIWRSTIGQLLHELRHKFSDSFLNREIFRLKNVDANVNNQVYLIL